MNGNHCASLLFDIEEEEARFVELLIVRGQVVFSADGTGKDVLMAR